MASTRVRGSGAATREDGFSRRRQGHQQRQGYQRRFAGSGFHFSGQAKTFFFYNFPEESQEADLWRAFQRYGRVVDVYVPMKRDKRGKRFGFVRMMGVQDVFHMEQRLNQIWIGLYKLRVRVAEDRVHRRSEYQRKAGTEGGKKIENCFQKLVQPDKSYVQVVAGNSLEEKRVSVDNQQGNTTDEGKEKQHLVLN
ncbi:hypothetical protein SLA2020_490030, partial [Shorea laevis]